MIARYSGPAMAMIAALSASAAQAEQYWTKTRIVGVSAVADDPAHPEYSRVFWVGLAEDSWLPVKCRALPGLLFSDSQMALTTLAMRAYELGETVVVKADDGSMIGQYCRLFQITMPADPMAGSDARKER